MRDSPKTSQSGSESSSDWEAYSSASRDSTVHKRVPALPPSTMTPPPTGFVQNIIIQSVCTELVNRPNCPRSVPPRQLTFGGMPRHKAETNLVYSRRPTVQPTKGGQGQALTSQPPKQRMFLPLILIHGVRNSYTRKESKR